MRSSQCVQITLQYLRTFSSPWDYQSLRLGEEISPNPFTQIFCHEIIGEIKTSNNIERIKQLALWFKDFGMLKLVEKRHVLQQLDELQDEPKVLHFMINQTTLITISIISRNWNNNVVHLISLLLSNKIYTSIIFEMGWQSKTFIKENCRLWVQHAIETSTNMFQIFKWELLDGIEFEIHPFPLSEKFLKILF